MAQKHIFNAQAIRDAASIKPNYSNVAAFLRGDKDHKLKPEHLEQLKTIIKKGTDKMVERIDKELA